MAKQNTLIDLLKRLPVVNKNKTFIIESFSGETRTFGEIDKKALQIAAFLKMQGFKKGDRAAFFIPNSLELAELYFGCLYAGVVVVPMNPSLTSSEVGYVVSHSCAKAIFCNSNLVDKFSSLPPNKIEKKFSLSTAIQPAGWTGLSLDHLPEPSCDLNLFENMSENDDLAIFYTSGTTADPKGVVHKLSGVIGNALSFGEKMKLGPKNRFYNILQMSYLGGYFNLLLLPYVNSASVVLSEPFGIKHSLNFWEPIIRHQVNTLWLVPSIITILLEMDRNTIGHKYAADHIFFSLCGTAPLPVQVRKDFVARYQIPLYENYALSETLFLTTNSDSFPVKDGSVGKVLPRVEISIRGAQGEFLPIRENGEIFTKTPYLMRGYYDKAKQTAEDIPASEWFSTGDIGFLNEEGDLYVSGRKKDIIIRGGINISPASVENIICRHPAVLECAVVGVPNHLMGEEIVAVVRLNKEMDSKSIESDLIRVCSEHLSKIKVPSKFVFTDEIYKNPNGKILKRKIREWLIGQV